MNYKRSFLMAADGLLTTKRSFVVACTVMLLSTLTAYAQETITLPITFANKIQWKAVETTVTLDSEGEEVPAYELQNFESHQGVVRKGKVFYVPSALEDRIILLMQNVIMSSEQIPYIIQNRTNKTLIIYTKGRTVLSCPSSVINSQGPVSLFGEETDSLGFDNLITLYSSGRQNRATIEAVGDVSIQDLNIDMGNNRGIYAIRSVPSGKEAPVLTLNNVKGTMKGQKGATHGFEIIDGTRCELEGVEVTISDDGAVGEEDADDESAACEETTE